MAPKKDQCCADDSLDAAAALDLFLQARLIVGFHPDQATEACIDLARVLGIPWAVVPCCVFPSEFPLRRLNEKRVRTFKELIEYLQNKVPEARVATLPFYETNTSKNLVLYTLPEDVHG